MHKKSTFIAALVGDSVDGSDRLRASAQEGIRHHRLDRPLGGDLRLVFRVADRLGLAGAAEEPDTEQVSTTAARPLATYRTTGLKDRVS